MQFLFLTCRYLYTGAPNIHSFGIASFVIYAS